jgi:hypothetical protein
MPEVGDRMSEVGETDHPADLGLLTSDLLPEP